MKNTILHIAFPILIFIMVFTFSSTVKASNPIEPFLQERFSNSLEFSDNAYNSFTNMMQRYPNAIGVYVTYHVGNNDQPYYTIIAKFSNTSFEYRGGFYYFNSNCAYVYGNETSDDLIYTSSISCWDQRTIIFNSYDDFVSAYNPVDYDNPVFSSSIPVPEMTVTYVGIGLNFPTNVNGVYVDCSIAKNDAFYVQLQAKYSVADMVNVLLNDGVITYEYLDWYDGESFDIYGLRDNALSVHVTAQEFQDSWDEIIDGLAENSLFPQFTTNVPFWLSNPEAAKYVAAKDRYKNVLMRQAPMYGSRMELFARYYAIVDSEVYVGRWVHWNSINPSNTEELSNQYQPDQPFPGYQNTSNNIDLPESDNTYTEMGESTNVNQNPYTQVVVNNNVPNYPDYPTVATYNHDNILVQFITTAKQLPNFFGDFGSFLTASFEFIPSYIWAVIGFGFMCSIVVMIIKVL